MEDNNKKNRKIKTIGYVMFFIAIALFFIGRITSSLSFLRWVGIGVMVISVVLITMDNYKNREK